ncbi:MAG: M13 family metallopeptidase [Arachnia sp.]
MPVTLLTHIDAAVSPREDLFRYANGDWLARCEIDPDKSSAGAFVELRDASEIAVRTLLDELPAGSANTESGKLAALYAAYMDTQRVEDAGAAALAPLLAHVDGICDQTTLSAFLGWAQRHQIAGLIDFDADADPGDPQQVVLFVSQGGLGLPDEAYYRLDEHAEIRKAYLAHIARVLELAGQPDPQTQADAVLELETRIASHHWDRVRVREIKQAYNPMTWGAFTAAAPGIDWAAFLAETRVSVSQVETLVVTQPSFAIAASQLVAEVPVEQWRSWARWHAVASVSGLLSADFVDARFDFYERTLQGTKQLRPRWKRAVGFVEQAMGEAIGRRYVERYFPASSKETMQRLVAQLLEAYRSSITTLGWMTDATRAEALDKLSKFRAKIGYPNRWRDYSALEVSADDLVGNAVAARAFEFDYTMSKLAEPVDLDEWHMYPQTVNAYYHPLRNEIVFPAAILQPPFFDPEADDAVNYGAIGAVIGHEIGHGFDDQGSACDGDGRLRDWWSEADREAFAARTGALIEQYEGLSPAGADGKTVNGELTIGENIGDLGGLGIAYRAWLLAGGDPDGDLIEGFTPAQRFFIGWARAWRGKRRPELVKQLLAVDPHSPAEFRCNQTAANLEAFHTAFGTAPGDGQWLAPEARVTIW